MAHVIDTASPGDHVAALQLLFRHFPPEEILARVAIALPLVRDAERHRLNLLVAREQNHVVGAMLVQALPAGTSVLWPPQANSILLEDDLIVKALDWMRLGGMRVAQALLSPDEVALADPLIRHGFTNPTRLWYLRNNLDWPLELLTAAGPLTWQSYGEGIREVFHKTLLHTYRDTEDFPELNGIRPLAEVLPVPRVDGFEPRRWWLASENGQPVGVLMLVDGDEPGEWELAYLGVVPEARGRGWGGELLRKALADAVQAGQEALTLSVDARNESAWKIYRRWGFEPYAAREVFLRRILEGSAPSGADPS